MNIMNYEIVNRTEENSEMCDHILSEIDKDLEAWNYEEVAIEKLMQLVGKSSFYPLNSKLYLVLDKVVGVWKLSDNPDQDHLTTEGAESAKLRD